MSSWVPGGAAQGWGCWFGDILQSSSLPSNGSWWQRCHLRGHRDGGMRRSTGELGGLHPKPPPEVLELQEEASAGCFGGQRGALGVGLVNGVLDHPQLCSQRVFLPRESMEG